jgi:subtilisin family serine protease
MPHVFGQMSINLVEDALRSRIRAADAAAAVLVLGALVTANPVGASAGVPGSGKPSSEAARDTVTLITGDRVTVVGGKQVMVEPGKGRDRVTFATSRTAGRLRVIPTDARPALRSGRLDPRLFDVTGLIEFGYTDQHSKVLPLIVTGGSEVAVASDDGVLAGATNPRPVPGGTAVHVPKSNTGTVWRNLSDALTGARVAAMRVAGAEGPKVWLDGMRRLDLTESVPQIGAPTAWSAGYTGSGVKVGVVDGGVDGTHPDLAGRVVAEKDFTGTGLRDLRGHGTHVAATIASTGAAAGGYKGVAPGAQIVSAKACGDSGACADSAVLAAMAWAAEQGVKVINMSLGSGDEPEEDPLEAAVEKLTADHGILFVISAGNAGSNEETVGSPGSATSALSVGAISKTEALANFSSRGPRIGDGALKPDITAPGVDIVAARSKDAADGDPGSLHFAKSGTSMAAPHVAGAAAILAQKNPTWTPAQLKAGLMGSAKVNPDIAVSGQGAGRVDVPRSLTQAVLADPSSVSFGRQLWPHEDDEKLTRTITYRNTGPADLTFALSLSGGIPAGMFALSATSVTVPAGGTAAVTITADTRVPGPDAYYGGHLVATGGGQTVTTPFAVHKESERYNLRLEHLDRNGEPTDQGNTLLVNHETGLLYVIDAMGRAVEQRMPKGTYIAVTEIEPNLEGGGENKTFLVEPNLRIDKDRSIRFDARVAKPVKISVPRADAVPSSSSFQLNLSRIDGLTPDFVGNYGRTYDNLFVGQPDTDSRSDRVTSIFSSNLVKGPVTETSPYTYNLAWTFKGYLPTGLAQNVAEQDLATVDIDMARQGQPVGSVGAVSRVDNVDVPAESISEVSLPGKRVEYYNAAEGVQWVRTFTERGSNAGGFTSVSAPTRFEAGRRYTDRHNYGVFGPGFGADNSMTAGLESSVDRAGDTIRVSPAMHSPAGDQSMGRALDATTRIVVARDGKVIADEATDNAVLTDQPAAEAAYRVSVEANRGAPNILSTRVSATWTFRSANVAGTQPVGLPVSTVRFAPELNDQNTAAAGSTFTVPFQVQRNPGSAAGPAQALAIEVSYDDGATWSTPTEFPGAQSGVLTVTHPAGVGFVSLRARSTDTAGNTVEQTVIRAYRIA